VLSPIHYERRNDGAENDHELNGAAELSAEFRRGCLGMIDWNDDDGHAGHGVGDDAADGELRSCGGRCLESSSAVALLAST